MAANRKWYPDGRQKQLNFIKRWISFFTKPAEEGGTRKKWQALGLPEEIFIALCEAYAAALAALEAVVMSGLREGPLHTAAQEAFAEMERQARALKRRWVQAPPLSTAELDELDVKAPDPVRTPAPIPRHTPQIKVSNPEKHVIRATITRPAAGDQDLSAFRRIMRVGILSPDGKIPEKTGFAPWYISKIPTIPEELPKQLKANRQNEDIPLSALESGSKAYISTAYENSKGQTGPWSEIIEAIIT